LPDPLAAFRDNVTRVWAAGVQASQPEGQDNVGAMCQERLRMATQT
jgi:hypothetical protein